MEQFLGQVPDWIEVVGVVLLALTIAATVIVRMTPSTADDEAVGKVAKWLIKIVEFLPTIGINPRTKKLEEALKELKEKQAGK